MAIIFIKGSLQEHHALYGYGYCKSANHPISLDNPKTQNNNTGSICCKLNKLVYDLWSRMWN